MEQHMSESPVSERKRTKNREMLHIHSLLLLRIRRETEQQEQRYSKQEPTSLCAYTNASKAIKHH